MGAKCTFKLNRQPVAYLECEGLPKMPAFSGNDRFKNDPDKGFIEEFGPIPLGKYYIVDRPVGGWQGVHDFFYDYMTEVKHADWFGLFADDGKIDDHTPTVGEYDRWHEPSVVSHFGIDERYIPGHYEHIKNPTRGNFRLHPMGRYRLSEGCVTLYSVEQFYMLRSFLLKQPPELISGTNLRTYGTISVERQ